MKIVITYILVCVLVTFCSKKIASLDISELENILEYLKLEDLLECIEERIVNRCSQNQQKVKGQGRVDSRSGEDRCRVRFKRNCKPVKFTLPAIPRLRNIDAESVPAPVVLTASSYIWKPLTRCGECATITDNSEIEQKTTIDMKGLNECENEIKSGCKNGGKKGKKGKKTKTPSKKIGLGNRRLYGTPENGTRSKEKLSIAHPHFGLRTIKKGRGFLKEDMGSLEKRPSVGVRMFSESVRNRNVGRGILQRKRKMFGMKLYDRREGMQKLPKKLKTAQKSLKVDLNYYDGDNGLMVLNNLMKQFLTRIKPKSPHLAGKLKEAFKKFIVFNLIQTFLDSYKTSKRKMLAKSKSKLEDI